MPGVFASMVRRHVNQSLGSCSELQRCTCSASHICSAGLQHVKTYDLEFIRHRYSDNQARGEKHGAVCNGENTRIIDKSNHESSKEREQEQQRFGLADLHTLFFSLLKCSSDRNKIFPFLGTVRECENECTPETTRTTTI